MGISFYYAVQILWHSFLPNTYSKKGDTCVSPFCGMDETRARAARAPARDPLLTTPPNLPLIGEA